MRYAYYLEKSLLQMILQTYLSYCTHFQAYYWIKTTTILETWVLLLFSLQVFTTVCSSSDLVGSVSSLCVWRCGHLLVLLLSEEEVQWSPLYQLLPRTGLPWMCPGCTGSAWFSWSALEKRFREACWLTCAGLQLSCQRSAVKLEILSTFILCQNYDLWSRFGGQSEVSTEAGPRWVVYLGEGEALWRGVGGHCPSCPGGGGGLCTQSLITCLSWEGLQGTHALPSWSG